MKTKLKRKSYLIMPIAVLLLFIILLIWYSVTALELSNKMKGTPYEKYGEEWVTIQRELNMETLAKENKLKDCDLVKLTSRHTFNGANVSSFVVKCTGESVCKNCRENNGEKCQNALLVKDETLPSGTILVEEYTKRTYFYLEEVTDRYYPPADVTLDSGVLNIHFNPLNTDVLNGNTVAYIPYPRVINLFVNKNIHWQDFYIQSVKKYFVVYYN